jgi:outer membrane lipoprotein SlyB
VRGFARSIQGKLGVNTLGLEPKRKLMNTAIDNPGASLSKSNRMLWSVVGLLSAATLALGGVLVYQNQSKPAEVAVASPQPFPAAQVALVKPAESVVVEEAVESKPKEPEAPVVKAQPATKKIAATQAKPTAAHAVTSGPPPAQQWEPVAPVAMPEQRAVCAQCGVVQSVRPVQRESAGTGVGAVAGALLGGLVGNQFGGGQGKTVATVVGAIGGGMAGNTVEKRMKTQTLYEVTVRMEDGTTRTVEQTSLPEVGAHVTVQGNSITPAN